MDFNAITPSYEHHSTACRKQKNPYTSLKLDNKYRCINMLSDNISLQSAAIAATASGVKVEDGATNIASEGINTGKLPRTANTDLRVKHSVAKIC